MATYALRFITFALWRFSHPPEVAGQVDRATLIWLLQKFATMQSSLRDQGIIIFPSKPSRTMQCACNDAHCLELRSRVADRIFVNGKSLSEELVAELFKSHLIRHLAT